MRVHSKGSKDFDLESRSLTVLKKNFKLSVRMLKVLWYQNLVGRERILYGNSMIHNLYKKLNRTCLFILICSIVSYCYSKISRNSDQFPNWCSLCDWIKFSHYYRVINLLFRLWLYDIYGMSFKVWKRTESSWPSRSNLCQNDISGYHLRQKSVICQVSFGKLQEEQKFLHIGNRKYYWTLFGLNFEANALSKRMYNWYIIWWI